MGAWYFSDFFLVVDSGHLHSRHPRHPHILVDSLPLILNESDYRACLHDVRCTQNREVLQQRQIVYQCVCRMGVPHGCAEGLSFRVERRPSQLRCHLRNANTSPISSEYHWKCRQGRLPVGWFFQDKQDFKGWIQSAEPVEWGLTDAIATTLKQCFNKEIYVSMNYSLYLDHPRPQRDVIYYLDWSGDFDLGNINPSKTHPIAGSWFVQVSCFVSALQAAAEGAQPRPCLPWRKRTCRVSRRAVQESASNTEFRISFSQATSLPAVLGVGWGPFPAKNL